MEAAEANTDQGRHDLWIVINRARSRKTKHPGPSQSELATFGTDYPGKRMCSINFSGKVITVSVSSGSRKEVCDLDVLSTQKHNHF